MPVGCRRTGNARAYQQQTFPRTSPDVVAWWRAVFIANKCRQRCEALFVAISTQNRTV